MATLPLLIIHSYFSNSVGFKLLMTWTNSASFTKIWPQMQTLSHNKKCKLSTKNGYFSFTDCPFVFQNQAVDAIDKLCKFQENLTTHADFIA